MCVSSGKMTEFSWTEHVNRAQSAHKHPAKVVVLTEMLRKIFDVELEDLLPGIESELKSKVLGLRGSVDLLFTNVVFEVKTDLEREREDGKTQLRKYFQALIEKSPAVQSVGLLTDVASFEAYAPVFKDGRVVTVRKVGNLDISRSSPDECVLWLDSYIFSSPTIRPTAADLRTRFGPSGPSYSLSLDSLMTLWQEAEKEDENRLKLELWAKNLEIVYGSKPETESFVEQTYLVTLIKLIVYLRLSGTRLPSEADVNRALTGEYFIDYGITNLIEEDFFTWIAHPVVAEGASQLFLKLAKGLLRYDLSSLDEDFFKEIYQEIVERADRHRTGEYYTPEWVTELTLQQVRKTAKSKEPLLRILDPSCGSGTFLTNVIIEARKQLAHSEVEDGDALRRIVGSVFGIDINPLAVTVAKANYLVALGSLLRAGTGITVPVFVADSLRPAEVIATNGEKIVKVYDFPVDPDLDGIKKRSPRLQVPIRITQDDPLFRRALVAMKSSISGYRKALEHRRKSEVSTEERKELRTVAGAVFGKECPAGIQQEEVEVLERTLKTLLDLVDDGRDSIWIFILSNVYAPVVMSRNKFDAVVGNPPWIALRFIENKRYQGFIKKQVFDYELLSSKESHLFTQMEMATLFYDRSADLYLADGGIIGFVMPRSVLTGASHHERFRLFNKPLMHLETILDFEDVSPLFNVPTCTLVATKGQRTKYPVVAHAYAGELSEKNLKLAVAKPELRLEHREFSPPAIPEGKDRSPYFDVLQAGAALYPHAFLFLEFQPHAELGIDMRHPSVRTDEEARKRAHVPWKGLSLKGRINAEHLYASLLAGDIVSFGHAPLRAVFLPAVPTSKGYRMLDVQDLKQIGAIDSADWLAQTQKHWDSLGTQASKVNFPRFVKSINNQGCLEHQDSGSRFLLCYGAAGSNLAACVIDRNRIGMIPFDGQAFKPTGFVVDKTVWYFSTKDLDEAHYLCAVLNSDVINDSIKSLQTRGAWGPRHIHRRPFLLPVTTYDSSNRDHMQLAKLSRESHSAVASLNLARAGPAWNRKKARVASQVQIRCSVTGKSSQVCNSRLSHLGSYVGQVSEA